MFDAHAQKNILIVMLQIFDNLFHYKNILTVQWIKRLKLCMVTKVVSWQNEIRTLDVLKSPTWLPNCYEFNIYMERAKLSFLKYAV